MKKHKEIIKPSTTGILYHQHSIIASIPSKIEHSSCRTKAIVNYKHIQNNFECTTNVVDHLVQLKQWSKEFWLILKLLLKNLHLLWSSPYSIIFKKFMLNIHCILWKWNGCCMRAAFEGRYWYIHSHSSFGYTTSSIGLAIVTIKQLVIQILA